jgi:hypothetical protein
MLHANVAVSRGAVTMSSNAPVAVGPPASPSLAEFHPGKAVISSAQLIGRIGVDVEATVTYDTTQGFELIWQLVVDPHGPPTVVRPLNDDDLRTLLGEIKTALANPPDGLETKALESFGDIIEETFNSEPAGFGAVRFGSAVEEVFGGTITVIGHLGLGIDVVATVHDAGGDITWERHVVPRPPGPFRPLTHAERDALTAALSAWLESNPNGAWQRVLSDLEK